MLVAWLFVALKAFLYSQAGPTVSDIADQSTPEDTPFQVSFTIGDPDTPLDQLIVTAVSSDQSVVLDANLVITAPNGDASVDRLLTVTPVADANGLATIAVSVSDGVGTAIDQFVLTVNPVNDAPTIINPGPQQTSEGVAAIVGVTIGDPDNPPASLTLSATSSNQSVVKDSNVVPGGSGANRTVTLTPEPNAPGTTQITVTVSDGAASTPTSFTLTVTAVNDPPTISDVLDQPTNEDTPLTVNFTVDDVDSPVAGLVVTASSTDQTIVPNANLVPGGSGASRSLTITPAPNHSGPVTITVSVSDGTATSSDNFVLTVVSVNDAPLVTGLSDGTTSEDTTYGPITFSVTDVDTPSGTVKVTPASLNQTLVPDQNITIGGSGAATTITILPAPNEAGTASITLTADDTAGGVTVQSFVLTVTPVNDPPTIVAPASLSIPEDTASAALAFTVDDVETPANLLSVSATSSNQSVVPDGGITLGGTGTNRTVTVLPAQDAVGSATITLTVQDAALAKTQATFTVTVTPVNDAPTIAAIGPQTTNEDQASTVTPVVADVDTPLTSLTLSGTSSDQSVVADSGIVQIGPPGGHQLRITPVLNASGTATITAVVSDGALTAQTTFSLTVNPVNDPPTISNVADQTIPEDGTTGALAIAVSDVDTPPGSLLVTATSGNTALVPNAQPNLVVAGSGTSWTVTVVPAANQWGTALITLTVSDGTAQATDTFTVTVTAVNDPPSISSLGNATTNEDQPTAVQAFTVSDPDTPLNSLLVTATSSATAVVPNNPSNLVLGGSGGSRTIQVVPAANQSGTSTITVTVDDGAGGTDVTAFVVTVNPLNDDPVVSGLVDVVTNEDTTLGPLTFSILDVDTPAGSVQATGTSTNQTLIPNGNITIVSNGAASTITLVPAGNQSGAATITVQANDGAGGIGSQSFTFTVNAVNDAPTITNPGPQQTPEGTPTTVGFTIGDPDNPSSSPAAGLTLTATSTNQAIVKNQNVVLGGAGVSRTVTLTPEPSAPGTTQITVTVFDGTTSTPMSFTLTVSSVNDPPTITNIPDQPTNEDTSLTVNFTVDDIDSPVGGLIVSASSSDPAIVPNGNLVPGGSGASRSLTITPAQNRSGPVTITVSVSDGLATTNDTFVLTVVPVNDPPTITALSSQATNEDTPSTPQAFTIDDVDTPIGSLTLSAISSNTIIVPTQNVHFGGSGANRTVSVTPGADQFGPVGITVVVSDGTATAQTAFTLTVNPVNDAPVITGLANASTTEDTTYGPITFSVTDVDAQPGTVKVTRTSSNQTLVPDANITIGGAGTATTITVIPAADAVGTTTIVVTADDTSGGVTTQSFVLTVTPANDAPTITVPFGSQAIDEDSQTAVLDFAVADVDTPLGSLTVTASSSDTTLVPNGSANLTLSGTGAARSIVVKPAANQTGTATITLTVADGSGGQASATFDVTVNGVNDAPTITSFGTVTVAEDTTSAPIAFTVDDVDTPAASLQVTATSSDTTLVPLANISIGGSGNSRTIQIAPAPDEPRVVPPAVVSSTITLTVSDGARTATSAFTFRVTAVVDPPVISPIPDQQTLQDTPTPPIPFTITDADNPVNNPANGLTLTGSSSNQTLVPNGAIVFGGTGVNRTVSVVPELGQSGTATITVTVAGSGTSQDQFVLNVTQVPCTFALSATTAAVPAAGASGGFEVTPNLQSCGWTAQSSVPWIVVTSPPTTSPSYGKGGVAYTVAANTGGPRTGTINVGGAVLTVSQAGISCAYAMLVVPSGATGGSAAASFGAGIGSGNLSIATTAGCGWTLGGTAVAQGSFVTFPNGITGTASAAQFLVPFTLTPNATGAPRSATVTLGSQTVTLYQAGPVTSADSDGDGLPNTWEAQFGLDPTSITFDNGPAGDPDHDGITNIDEYRRGTHPRGFVTRFLAEGASSTFFQTLVAIANPSTTTPALVLVHFQRDDKTQGSQYVVVNKLSQIVIDVSNVAGFQSASFSTAVESDETVIVDRRMTWGAGGYGAHAETSVVSPQATWYLAEGATHSGFQLFYLLQNPDATTDAHVRVTYLLPPNANGPQAPAVVDCRVPAQARRNIYVNIELCPGGKQWDGTAIAFDPRLAATDVSAIINVVSGPPIVVERSMYQNSGGQFFGAGHAGAGIPTPSTSWYLAEGSTGSGFNTFLLLANPSASTAAIEVKFLRQGAAPVYLARTRSGFTSQATPATVTLPANSRETVWYNLLPDLVNTSMSTVITGQNGVGILAERAMWWPGTPAAWYEANNAAGVTLPAASGTPVGVKWGLADGEAGSAVPGGNSIDTFVLVANTSSAPAFVRLTLLFQNGNTATRDITVPANQRSTVWVNIDRFVDALGSTVSVQNQRFGILVESQGTTPGQIVVERAMYWDAVGQRWAAGTNAVATRLQ